MGQGVWEGRTQLRDRIARVLFCVFEEQRVLRHGFIEKTRKTPPADLDLARQRKRDLEKG
jgi:phage-related protein